MGVVEAGHGEGAVEVDDLGVGGFELQDFGVGADGEDGAIAGGDGSDASGRGIGVRRPEMRASEDVAVDEDRVRSGGRWVVAQAAERAPQRP